MTFSFVVSTRRLTFPALLGLAGLNWLAETSIARMVMMKPVKMEAKAIFLPASLRKAQAIK